MRKLFTLFFAIVASVGTMRAEIITGACGDSIFWTFNTADSTLIVSGNGGIPCEGEGGPWERNSGVERSNISYVVLQEGITSLGSYNFYYCDNLKSIELPQSLIAINESAICDCDALSFFEIPQNVTIMPAGAIHSCSTLKTIIWHPKNFKIDFTKGYGRMNTRGPLYGINYSITTLICDEEVEDLPNYFCYGMNNLTSVTLPPNLKSIGSEFFSGCTSLTSVQIPDSVISIDTQAFEGCTGLTSITIPDKVTRIGGSAFNSCASLVSVTIPNSVTNIGTYAFDGCNNLKSVHIDDISAWCKISFAGDGNGKGNPLYNGADLYVNGELLTDLVIPESVTSVEDYVFINCNSLQTVTIPTNLTYLGDRAFAKCPSLTSVIWNARKCKTRYERHSAFDNYIRDNEPFYNSAINSFVFGEEVDSIPDYLCNSLTNLSSVLFSSNTKYIGKKTFSGCVGLSSITLPKKLINIGNEAFRNCTGLTTIYSNSQTPPFTQELTFNGISASAIVYVPFGYAGLYKNDDIWSVLNIQTLIEHIIIPSSTSASITFLTDGVITSCGFEGGEQQPGNMLGSTGLEPNTEYLDTTIVLTANTGETDTVHVSFTTTDLELTTQPSKPVSSSVAILLAETNMADIETSCGFEYKRNDAPEDMAGTKVFCPVASGQMAGRLKNLKDDVYYKYRAFYQSAAGNMYYGDWQYIFTGDVAVEFDPILYTYAATVVRENEATITGYALAGSEDFTEQGFEYWAESRTNGETNAPVRMPAALGEHFFVQVDGIRMTVTLTDLDAGTNYKYRAYGKVGEQYYYGSEQSFTTQGEYIPSTEAVENTSIEAPRATKILRNGQIFILRGEKVYSVTGQWVR